jgi:hypothetical protein
MHKPQATICRGYRNDLLELAQVATRMVTAA